MALAKSKWCKKLAGMVAALAFALAMLFGGNFAPAEQASINTGALPVVVADGGTSGSPTGG